MKISYKTLNKNVVSTSMFEKAKPTEAMFFVSKEKLVSLETSFGDSYDFTSKIYETEVLKTKIKVKSNTTDLLATNIEYEGVPMYYKVVVVGSSFISLDTINSKTIYKVVAIGNNYYTNDTFENVEVLDGTFIHSEPVINPLDFEHSYYSNYILTTFKKTNNENVYVKPLTDFVINAKLVNDNKLLLPSFYIKTRDSTIKVIEGDIVFYDKVEKTQVKYNKLKPKDLVAENYSEYYFNSSSNTFYTTDAFLEAEEVIIKYRAKISSHIFELDSDFIYFKINKGYLETTTNSEDFDIRVERKVDNTNIDIYPNKFLNTYTHTFNPSSYGLKFFSTPSILDKGFTKLLFTTTLKNPSETYYVSTDKKSIKQVTVNDTIIKSTPITEIESYLEADYKEPLVKAERLEVKLPKGDSKAYFKGGV